MFLVLVFFLPFQLAFTTILNLLHLALYHQVVLVPLFFLETGTELVYFLTGFARAILCCLCFLNLAYGFLDYGIAVL